MTDLGENPPLPSSPPRAAPSREDVRRTVIEAVAEVIAADPAGIAPETNLMEAGLQSLEFLEVVFKLEQAWDIEITRGEMERAARGDMSDEEFAPNGIISEAGLVRLRTLMPEAAERIAPGLRSSQILGLFSVETFVNLVLAKQT